METGSWQDDTSFPIPKTLTFLQERELQQNLIADIQLAETLFDEDRVGEAHFLLKNIDEFIKLLPVDGQNQISRIMEKSNRITGLRAKGKELVALLDLINNKEDFNAWNSSIGPHQDVTVYTHSDEKRGESFVKLEGNLHCRLLEATAALLESELYSIWTPMCKGAQCLGKLSVCRRIMMFDLEFVLMQRKALCDVHLDVLPDGNVLLSFSPLPNNSSNKAYFPSTPTANLYGGILLREAEVEVEEMMSLSNSRAHPAALKNNNSSSPEVIQVQSSSANVSYSDIYEVLDKDEEIFESAGSSGRSRSRPRGTCAIPMRSSMNIPHNPSSSTIKRPSVTLESRLASLSSKKQPVKYRKRVVACTAVMRVELNLDFIPDWIFNLAIRSAIAMFLPMAEHQANLFEANGPFFSHMQKNNEIYSLLHSKLEELKKASHNK